MISRRQLNHVVAGMMGGEFAAPEPANISEDKLYEPTTYRPFDTTSSGLDSSSKIVVEMTSGEALSAGDVVWISANNTVKKTLSGIVIHAALGVVAQAVGSGNTVQVIIIGKANVVTDDALVAGDLVRISATTAGRVEKYTGHLHAVGTLDSAVLSGNSAGEANHNHGYGTLNSATLSANVVAESSHTHGVGSYDSAVLSGDSANESIHTHDAIGTVNSVSLSANTGSNPGGGSHVHDMSHDHAINGTTAAGAAHLHSIAHDHAMSGTSSGGSSHVHSMSHDHAIDGSTATGSSHLHSIAHDHAMTGSVANTVDNGVLGVCIVSGSGGGTVTIVIRNSG
jgi:hypothetical protein